MKKPSDPAKSNRKMRKRIIGLGDYSGRKSYYPELQAKLKELKFEISERRRAEEELRKHRDHLEELVDERTAELQQEITNRKQVEVQLREKEEKYRLLVEHIPSVTWVTSEHGKTTFISPNLEKIFGYTQEEIYEGS
ncbi:MAG: PAS domain S-box protein, partial [bacterium]|nr:PAS domain S-box protein [bacterium]